MSRSKDLCNAKFAARTGKARVVLPNGLAGRASTETKFVLVGETLPPGSGIDGWSVNGWSVTWCEPDRNRVVWRVMLVPRALTSMAAGLRRR